MSMWKKTGLVALVALVVLGGLIACSPCRAEAAPVQITDENLAQMLEKLLQERPDLVMDVLRNNSEAVLDIAQQGSACKAFRTLCNWPIPCRPIPSLKIFLYSETIF